MYSLASESDTLLDMISHAGGMTDKATPDIIVQIDGREVAKAVVSATKDGAGDGVNTLALA